MYELFDPATVLQHPAHRYADVEPSDDVLTPAEAATFLRLSLNTTYTYLRLGVIPGERVGRRWILSRGRLLAWLSGSHAEVA